MSKMPRSALLEGGYAKLVLSFLLPLGLWYLIGRLFPEEFSQSFIVFLVPVLLASWWGLSSGAVALLASTPAAWDVATRGTPAFDFSAGGSPSDILGGVSFLAAGVLVVLAMESARRRSAESAASALAAQTQGETATRFRALFDSAPIACLLIDGDHDGCILACNRAAESILRGTSEQIVGMTPADISPMRQPDGRLSAEAAQERLRDALERGTSEFEWVHQRLDGEELWAQVMVSKMPGGEIDTLIVSLLDISEKKRAEEQRSALTLRLERQNRAQVQLMRDSMLREGENLAATYRGITKLAAEALGISRVSIWFYDDEARVLRCDDLFELQTGTHTDGLTLPIGSYPSYFAALAEVVPLVAHDAQTDPRTREFNESYLKPLNITSMLDVPILTRESGVAGVICCEHTGTPRNWTFDEQAFASSIADSVMLAIEAHERREAEVAAAAYRTELEKIRNNLEEQVVQRTAMIEAREADLRKHAATLEERILERTRALKKTNEDLESFARTASHDLRAPLRAIRNLAVWIQEDLSGSDAYTDEMNENFTSLKGRVYRMEGMISALLEYSRLNKMDLVPEEVDLQELIDELVDLLDPPKGFKIETELRPPSIRTYRTPLQRILLNLLNNAIKHHDRPEKGMVTIHSQKENGFIRVTVEDNGPGIPEHSQTEALNMFRTLTSKDEKEASGMGLAIVSRIITQLGGQVELGRRPGDERGLLVTFTLPDNVTMEQGI